MLKTIKRWWYNYLIKEHDNDYVYSYVMEGFYASKVNPYEVKRRALQIKLASIK